MTNDFTAEQRELIFERDGWRCLACGSRDVTMQHRRAKGMGGRGQKAQPLTCADGLPLCALHNEQAEASMQAAALGLGWKLKRFSLLPASWVPYWDSLTRQWWVPDEGGQREWMDANTAIQRVRTAAGSW